MNKFEFNKELKNKLKTFDSIINPFQREDFLLISEDEYPDNLEVIFNDLEKGEVSGPSKSVTIINHSNKAISKNVSTRNTDAYYLNGSIFGDSAFMIAHNMYRVNHSVMNELSICLNNNKSNSTIQITYNITNGELLAYKFIDGKKINLSNEEARNILLNTINYGISYAKDVIIDNIIDNGYSKKLNYSER